MHGDFDFPEDRQRNDKYRKPSAFQSAFGGAMGVLLAILVVFVVIPIILGLIVLAIGSTG